MKTNHRRDYKDGGSYRARYGRVALSKLSGAAASIGGNYTKGHRGAAKAKAGAKKYVRVRDRLVNKKLAKDALREVEK